MSQETHDRHLMPLSAAPGLTHHDRVVACTIHNLPGRYSADVTMLDPSVIMQRMPLNGRATPTD